MKTIRLAGFLLLVVAFSLPGVAKAAVEVGFSIDFHDALGPYGTWVHVSSCPDCWRPAAPGFVPFTYGHWVYTSYGPTWEGDEPWAWAPYHYGQWVYTAQYGWIWAPGYEWSPGRVSWAYGDDYIGWSPVIGASVADPNMWIVVHRDNFGSTNYAPVRIQRDTVNVLFERRAVRITSLPLQRTQVEHIVRHPIQVQAVHEHEIEVNHHRTHFVVTQDRDAEVVKHIEDASAKHQSADNGQRGDHPDAKTKAKKSKNKPPDDRSHDKD